MEDLKEAIANLPLESLTTDWINAVWDGEFPAESELPIEVTSEVGLTDLYEKIYDMLIAIKKWINEGNALTATTSDANRNYSWHFLSDLKLRYKPLLCFLSSFVKIDMTVCRDVEAILGAFTAARLYILFLSVPGSLVFNIFHPAFFDNSMKLLAIGKVLMCDGKKPTKSVSPDSTSVCDETLSESPQPSASKNVKSKSSKHKKSKVKKSSKTDDIPNLSDDGKKRIIIQLCSFLSELCECLNSVKLKGEIFSMKTTVTALIDTIRLEPKKDIFANPPKINTFGFAALKAFTALGNLCSEEHGCVKDIVRDLIKGFYQVLHYKENFLGMTSKDDDSGMRTNIFSFLLNLYSAHHEEAKDVIFGLMQRLLMTCPDRAEPRTKIVNDVFQVINSLPTAEMADFSIWNVSLTHNDKVKYRVTAIELLSKFLSVNDETECKRFHELQIGALLLSCNDKSPLVRHKSLNTFALCILSNQSEVKEIITKLFVSPKETGEFRKLKESDFIDINIVLNEMRQLGTPWISHLPAQHMVPEPNVIVKFIEGYCTDGKVFVRKAALLALSNICLLEKLWMVSARLKYLEAGSRDVSVMVRKQMAKCITDILLTYPTHKGIIETWVNSLISLIGDNDSKNQERVIEYIHDVIIKNIRHADEEETPENTLPWKIVYLIARKGKRTLFRIACMIWIRNNLIGKSVYTHIVSHVGKKNNINAWLLICCLSEFTDYPDPLFIYKYFMDTIYLQQFKVKNDSLQVLVMEALFLNRQGLPPEIQEELFLQLKMAIENFQVPIHLISRSLDILFKTNEGYMKIWCGTITQAASNSIISINLNDDSPLDDVNSSVFIIALGDAAMYHPGVQEDVINRIIGLIKNEDLEKKFTSPKTDLKAACVVTLSKLCLQDHFLAKKYVPDLAYLLQTRATVAVKVNALAGLADLCVRFTSVVEDYICDMCLSLKDKNPEIRKVALEYICQLVMEDYLKLKSPLFYYLLTTLLDPIVEIKEIYINLMLNCVTKKYPHMMAGYFINSIFFFNDYEGWKGINKSDLSDTEKIVFGLSGGNNFTKRQEIYKFMLRAMIDDDRFKIQNRICIDVLEAVCDDKITLNIPGFAVLKDAINSLSLKEMRLDHLRRDDEEQPAEENTPQFAVEIARKMILTQILKKNYVENLVPTVARLKHKLQDLKSPLTRDLMICLREIMKDFKTEINEIFAEDPQLAAEVAFDLQNVETDDSLTERLQEVVPAIQLHLSLISNMAEGTVAQQFLNQSLNQILQNDDRPTPPPQVQQGINDSINAYMAAHGSPLMKDKTPLMKDKFPTNSLINNVDALESVDVPPSEMEIVRDVSKLSTTRKKLSEIFNDETLTSSASGISPKTNSDLSTEYSSNVPVVLPSHAVSPLHPDTDSSDQSVVLKVKTKRGGRRKNH